jgi:hypothetical protein
MQSTPQQSPSISLCPFRILAAPTGGILPHIAESGQRHEAAALLDMAERWRRLAKEAEGPGAVSEDEE